MITSGLTVEPAAAAIARSIFRRLFVPVDFSESSRRAIGVALDLQKTHGSDVCAFRWLEGMGSESASESEELARADPSEAPLADGAIAETEDRLRRFLEDVVPGASRRCEVEVRFGETIASIRRAAEEWAATLVIAATPVHQFWRSPAERLVHDVDVPTLVIPSDARAGTRR